MLEGQPIFSGTSSASSQITPDRSALRGKKVPHFPQILLGSGSSNQSGCWEPCNLTHALIYCLSSPWSFYCPCWARFQPQIESNPASLFLSTGGRHTYKTAAPLTGLSWIFSGNPALCCPPPHPVLYLVAVLNLHSLLKCSITPNQFLLWNFGSCAYPWVKN